MQFPIHQVHYPYLIILLLFFVITQLKFAEGYLCYTRKQFPKFFGDDITEGDSEINDILEINNNGDLLFGGALNQQPFIARHINTEYYNLISWMKIYQTSETRFGTVYSVDQLAYKSLNNNEKIIAAIRVMDDIGFLNIFIARFEGDGKFKEGSLFKGNHVTANKVRQMIVFNDEQELIWAYQLGQTNGRISKFQGDLYDMYYTFGFTQSATSTVYIRSLYLSPSQQNVLYFGGQILAANGNDLLFGYFDSHGNSVNFKKVIGLSMSCSNCMSHSINMIYGYPGNGQKQLFGCISNEHHVGIHLKQASNLEIYITREDTDNQARGFFYLNQDLGDIYSPNQPRIFQVQQFVFKNPSFTDNYIHINRVTYFHNSMDRIYLSGFYKNKALSYNKAFMHQIGDDSQNADLLSLIGTFGQSQAQLQSIVSQFYPQTLVQLQSAGSVWTVVPGYYIDYEIKDIDQDGRLSSITLPGFIPILSYTEETPLFNFFNSNKTYECFIGKECIVNVGNLTLENCEEGIDSYIRLNVTGQTADMSFSNIIHYSVDDKYKLPFVLSSTYTPTGLSFQGLDYTDYLLTINTFFDYPYNPNEFGVFKDFQFYLRIWDECTYYRNYIYLDPHLDQVSFVLGQSMSYYILPKLGISLNGSAQRVNIAPYFETSLKNQTINVGASAIYNLPRTFDQNENEIVIEYRLGVTQLFTDTVENHGQGIIFFNPKKEHIGDYAVEIWLKDDHPTQPLTTKYKFGIIVVGGNGSFGFENITEEEKYASQTQFIGNIRAKIKRIDYKGEMLILFETNIKIPPNYAERLNKSLEINLQQNSNTLKTNYSIVNMKGNKMTIQLYFDNPANISNEYEWDYITVKFLQNYFYVAMRILLGSLGDGSSASVQAFMGGNLILSIFMQAIDQKFNKGFIGVRVYSIYGE
eukprot:403377512